MAFDAFLSYLIDQSPEVLQALSRAFPQMLSESVSPITSAERFGEAASTWGSGLTESPQDSLTRRKAQKAIKEREEREAEEKALREKQTTGGPEIDALMQRAKEYQDLTKEEEVLGVPGTGAYIDSLPQDKLRAIREQALAKGGTPQGLKEKILSKPRQGGTFNVAPDSPEIQMRLAERDKWLQQEYPMSMATFMLSPEQIKRNPQGIAAAEQLRGISGERRAQQQQEMTNKLVQMMGDNKGRIPFERANQLAALGVTVPARAIGASIEDASQFLDRQVMLSQQDMQQVDPFDMTGSGRVVAQFSRAAQLYARQLKERVLAGEMSPDDAMDAFWQYASSSAMQLGLLQNSAVQGGPEQPQGQ